MTNENHEMRNIVNYLKSLIEERKFSKLFKPLTFESRQYLESRGLDKEVLQDIEIYTFRGDFDKRYYRESVVVPLRYPDGLLFGVWMRCLNSKFFSILLFNSKDLDLKPHEKFWVQPNFDFNKPNIIFESIFDALSFKKLHPEIECNISSSLGFSPTEKLLKINTKHILAFDNDPAGYASMLKLCDKYDVLVFDSLKYCKDFNELLLLKPHHTIEIKTGIEAKVYLRFKTF